jgi:methylglyoxal synthase
LNQGNNIVIVAHDNKKLELVKFLQEKEDWLWGRTLVATGLTADFVEEKDFKVPVEHLSAGRDGGYVELAELVRSGKVKMVLFFRDPELLQDYAEEVNEFVKTCNRQNIPLATNASTAELIILGMIRLEAIAQIKSRATEL